MDGSCFHQCSRTRRTELGLLVLGGSSLHCWLKSVLPCNVVNILSCGSGVDHSKATILFFFCFFNFEPSQSDQPSTENSRSSFYLYKGVITPPGWSVSPAVITGGSVWTWIRNIREEWKSLANMIELAVGSCRTRISDERPCFCQQNGYGLKILHTVVSAARPRLQRCWCWTQLEQSNVQCFEAF